MPVKEKKTRLSSKGQVVIPKAVREAHGWTPGQEFLVEDTGDELVLRPEPLFPPTDPDEVFGCLKYDGPPVSIREMDEAILRSVREEWIRKFGAPGTSSEKHGSESQENDRH